ncbi:flavin monoamine oxidase family protein [Robertmurraya massiliosenegalensis]|uniref:flavin monoamine oxidase family protein n=1 Tax=Robertmurraya TaxID=2837507 RepID=UPI0039A55B07
MSRVATEYSYLNYPDDMLYLIRNGLNKGTTPKRILIAGAGMAGLVAASLLKQAGHRVTVVEGNSRIGGRIYTVRKPFSDGNYLDFGAMRIPDNHLLVLEYIRRFKLKTNNFINATPNDLIYVNNVLTTSSYYEQNPDVLRFPLSGWEKGKTATELFLAAVQPFLDRYQHSTTEEQEELMKQFDDYSMEAFLRDNPYGPSLSLNAIRLISIMLGMEGFRELSFVGIVTDIIYPIFNEDAQFFEIVGGNDRLPYSFLTELRNEIYLNEKITKIIQDEQGVFFQTTNQVTGQVHTFTGDYAIITIPFSALQLIDIEPYESITFNKRQAIREILSISSVKVGIEFRYPFWESYQVGNAISDLPTRFSYIPSHNIGRTGPAVMLASYSWGHDAALWNSLSNQEVIQYVLKDLAKIYGSIVYQEFLKGVTFNWGRNPFSAGCFTLYAPGQKIDLGDVIYQPEGRMHFAGEHTSTFHGWVEGAVESGIRVAYEVNGR